jgi:hypothetical protein
VRGSNLERETGLSIFPDIFFVTFLNLSKRTQVQDLAYAATAFSNIFCNSSLSFRWLQNCPQDVWFAINALQIFLNSNFIFFEFYVLTAVAAESSVPQDIKAVYSSEHQLTFLPAHSIEHLKFFISGLL